jgi:hypothetical protein
MEVYNTCQSTCDVSRLTPLRSFRNREMEMIRTPTTGVTKSRKRLMHKAVFTALDHISERWTDIRGQGGAKGNDTKGDMTGMGPFLDTPPFRNPPL